MKLFDQMGQKRNFDLLCPISGSRHARKIDPGSQVLHTLESSTDMPINQDSWSHTRKQKPPKYPSLTYFL